MMAGVTEEELEELGLGSMFGVQKTEKKKETRVEAPKFVGMDILLVKAPRYTSPGAYEDIDILIGNNYYGSTAGNLTVSIILPFGFTIESILAASDNFPITPAGPTKNIADLYYRKMEYGDGDVITMSIKVPEREYTANIRYYYPIKITMNYWYSIMLKESIPAVSSFYYRALGGEINKTLTIDRTAGEVMITPRKEIGVIRIPDLFFDGKTPYYKTFVFKIQNIGKGVVLGNYTIYFLGFYKENFINISLSTEAGNWKRVNKEVEANKLEKIGLDYAAEIIRNAPVVYALNVSKYSEYFSATLNIIVHPSLQSTVFEIPAIFLVVYNYEISKDIYIRIEKVMP